MDWVQRANEDRRKDVDLLRSLPQSLESDCDLFLEVAAEYESRYEKDLASLGLC